jgi:hypothetical protein
MSEAFFTLLTLAAIVLAVESADTTGVNLRGFTFASDVDGMCKRKID